MVVKNNVIFHALNFRVLKSDLGTYNENTLYILQIFYDMF